MKMGASSGPGPLPEHIQKKAAQVVGAVL